MFQQFLENYVDMENVFFEGIGIDEDVIEISDCKSV